MLLDLWIHPVGAGETIDFGSYKKKVQNMKRKLGCCCTLS